MTPGVKTLLIMGGVFFVLWMFNYIKNKKNTTQVIYPTQPTTVAGAPTPTTTPATSVAAPPAPAPVRASSRSWGWWLIWLLILVGIVAGGWVWWAYGPPVPVQVKNFYQDSCDRMNGQTVRYTDITKDKQFLAIKNNHLLKIETIDLSKAEVEYILTLRETGVNGLNEEVALVESMANPIDHLPGPKNGQAWDSVSICLKKKGPPLAVRLRYTPIK